MQHNQKPGGGQPRAYIRHLTNRWESTMRGVNLVFGCIREPRDQGRIPTKTEGGMPAVSWIQLFP